ncbi:hypothetical protein CYY_006840 [Polysphondylium violaceum]|uniref:Mitochondrial Rho GTPase n=1 Tax=Polysphondylium violaceum TaxID=133409 RepID=A0A8J4UYH0_9MYCE|nr:hypothetical protein CYY_006840 [Polysphondylium violaceum]
MKPFIKILLIGDENVGKTTIISSLISESFSETVPKIIPEVTIPAEFSNVGCTTRIIDTGSDDKNIALEIKTADVIVILYSVDRFDTFMNIRMKWMPLVKQLRSLNKVPVVIVGNKLDLLPSGVDNINRQQIEETIEYLKSSYEDSLQWVECSAKEMTNIHEMLYNAQTLAVFPEKLLYNREQNKMSKGCEKALKRIFKLCDQDNDGSLNDFEINYFQSKCGHESMDTEEISNLKQFVSSKIQDGVDENGFTESGFIFMNQLFLERGPCQHTWISLRAFHYDDGLELEQDYLEPTTFRSLLTPLSTTFLSTQGNQFFKSLFEKYDSNQDGILSKYDIENMFSITTPAIPWQNGFEHHFNTNKNGDLTLSGFLSLWNYQTYKDYRVTFRYLAYFGCDTDKNNIDMISISKTKEMDLGSFSKGIVNCFVFGSEGCGKTTFLNSFIDKPFNQNNYLPTNENNQVCGQILNKYLILNEYTNPLKLLGDKPINSVEMRRQCDIICLLFEDNNEKSFLYVQSIFHLLLEQNGSYQNQNSHVPILFIKTKCNSNSSNSNNSNQTPGGDTTTPTPTNLVISKFFKVYKSYVPKEFNISTPFPTYVEIMNYLMSNSNSSNQSNSNQEKALTSTSGVLTYLLVLSGLAGAGLFIFKYLKR